ncbi:MAG: hypothetical protein R3A46_20875 [Thermomicrobiales bacterium]
MESVVLGAVMDTNDPALAVWKYAGADLTIIPIDDNRSSVAYETVVDLLRAFGSGAHLLP